MEVDDSKLIFTIGHSTHSIHEFIALLKKYKIKALIDIRSFPSSRHCPQFNQDNLEKSLKRANIEYQWIKNLGGRRHSTKSALQSAWKNPAFQAYADYTETDEFIQGLAHLIEIAHKKQSALMCAEGLWWRCHRRIISDCLLVLGWHIMHIMPNGQLITHKLTEFAHVIKGRLIYR